MRPVVDLVLIFDELGDGHCGWPDGLPKELESGFTRGAVGFAVVDLAVGENAVFPGGGAAARAGLNVVDVGFGKGESSAGVLAAAAVPFEETLEAELEPLAWHAIEGAEDDDGGDADAAVSGADGGVVFPDVKILPIGPRDRDHPVGALDIEPGDLVVHHGAEDFGGAGGGEGKPVPVQNEDGGFVEVSGHFTWEWSIWRGGARGRNRTFIFGIKVRGNGRHTTRVKILGGPVGFEPTPRQSQRRMLTNDTMAPVSEPEF